MPFSLNGITGDINLDHLVEVVPASFSTAPVTDFNDCTPFDPLNVC